MKTIRRTFASLLAASATLAAGVATAQVTVNAPANNPVVPPANVQAGPVNVQSGPAGTTVNVPPAATNAARAIGERASENAANRQINRQERIEERQVARENWRMKNVNGRWWYWGPNNQWSYYHNNLWTPYVAPSAGPSQAVQAYRQGPLGLRRYSMGYRGTGALTPPPAPVNQAIPAPANAAPSSTQP